MYLPGTLGTRSMEKPPVLDVWWSSPGRDRSTNVGHDDRQRDLGIGLVGNS